MGIWLGPRGGAGLEESDFTYSGTYLFKTEGRRWELALLSGNAASLVFSRNPGRVDIFAVGGGQSGQYYSGEESQDAYSGPSHGGNGGNGGECVSLRGVRLAANTNYAVTIGASNQSTTLAGGTLNLVAATAGGSSGGAGGVVYWDTTKNDASAGTDGVFAYGDQTDTMLFTETEFPGHLFGPGGGGAGSMLLVNRYGSVDTSANAIGGESNGPTHQYGNGGSYGSHDGGPGYPNHGQGGGGPYYYRVTTGGGRNAYGNPGVGGSGIILIRGAL